MPEKKDELGGLWEKTTKNGAIFLSGTIDGVRVVCWYNDRKQEGSREPNWRVYKDTWEKPQAGLRDD